MKLLKLLKRLAFGLLGAVMAVLVTATVLEKIYGTDFAAAHIYGAGWFAALWGALTLAALACLFRRKLWRRPAVLLLHLSFAVILAGASVTWLFGRQGTLHLRTGVRPKLAPSQLMPLTGLIAVAMSRAVDRVAGTHSQIKWTNDLILNSRKLCGILTELSVEGETGELQYVVAGIGFNVSQREEDFAGEVSKIATSILRETGRLISRAELSAAMIEELDALYTALRSGETSGYLDEYRRRCVTIGREVQLLWQDTKEKVTALDVDEEFGLIVRRENGTVETVRTGEVSVRGLYGYVE